MSQHSSKSISVTWFIKWIMVWILACAAVYLATDMGLRAREMLWQETRPIRYTGDINNGWYQGKEASAHGIVARFEDLYLSQRNVEVPDYGLDYPPLRLWMMTQWASWTVKYFHATGWQPSWEFNAPVLWANTIAHELSAILTAALIWIWMRRTARDTVRADSVARSALCAAVGALLLWFNPAVLWNGHAFPQWDMWLMPFFLGALLAASLNAWFVAGAMVIFGAMFKGQMLLAAPLFLLWPIFAGQMGATARVIIGALFATAVCAAPWSVRTPESTAFLRDILAACAILAPGVLIKRLTWIWLVLIALAGALLLRHVLIIDSWRFSTHWPFFASISPRFDPGLLRLAVLCFGAFVVILRYIHVSRFPHAIALACSIGTLLCIPMFKGSPAWLYVGFEYGARKYPVMGTLSASNLPTLLERKFGGWQPTGPAGQVDITWLADVMTWLPLPRIVELRTVLLSLFVTALVACAAACAIQARRRDARLLAGACAVWVWAFLLLPQMHNRYLIWGAATSPLLCATGVGPALAGIAISLACCSMMVINQIQGRPDLYPTWISVLQPMHVDMAWLLLLLAGAITCVGLSRRRYASAGALSEVTDVVSNSVLAKEDVSRRLGAKDLVLEHLLSDDASGANPSENDKPPVSLDHTVADTFSVTGRRTVISR